MSDYGWQVIDDLGLGFFIAAVLITWLITRKRR